MSGDVHALAQAAFASLQPTGLPPASPFDRWSLALTPPLPVTWPGGTLVYYAYARRRRAGLVDGEEVSTPFARIDRGAALSLTRITNALAITPHGTEGVRPLTTGECALLDSVAAAGSLETLLARAPQDAATALLVRRRYCLWASTSALARLLLPHHPAFAAFLDCANVVVSVEPVPHPSAGPLLRAEFDRHWPRSPTRDWQLGETPAFPLEWPARADTSFVTYGVAYRVDRTQPVPCPREFMDLWAAVVRQGVDGPLSLTRLSAEQPRSLGIQAGRSPARDHYVVVGQMGVRPIDMLVRAASEREIAALVRRFYGEWREGDLLLAERVLARHPGFAAFLRA